MTDEIEESQSNAAAAGSHREAGLQQVLLLARDLWNRRWIGLLAAWVLAPIAAAVVLLIPERHEVTARVYVDTQTVLKPLMNGLTVQPDIDQMVGILARTLISRPNVEQLVVNGRLDASLPSQRAREELIETLMRDIRVTTPGAKNVFDITYPDVDTARGLRVVEELVRLFVSSGQSDKRRDTEEARRFIDQQIAIYEKKLGDAETRLKEFKLRNVDIASIAAGAAGQDYFSRMAAAQQEMSQVRVDLRAAEMTRDALDRELKGVQDAEAASDASASVTPELDARIETQKKQLDELLRRYTPNHPDVIATQRLISELEQERRREAESKHKAAAAKGVDSRSGVALQQIQVKRADAEANVAALKGRLAELTGRLQDLRAAAARIPQVEADLAQLNRDYEVVRKNYEQLVQRRESASMSGDADVNAPLAEFRVIDPPHVNPKPVFPSRLVLVTAALLACVGVGGGAAFASNQVMPTITSARALRQIGGRPVLGSISRVMDGAELAHERWSHVMFIAAFGGLVIVYATWAGLLALHLL